jgi:hypothetical protein
MITKNISDAEFLKRLDEATAHLSVEARVSAAQAIRQRFLEEGNEEAAALADMHIAKLTKCHVVEMILWIDRRELPAGEATCQRSGERSFMASRAEADGSRGEKKQFRLCSLCAESPGSGMRGDA